MIYIHSFQSRRHKEGDNFPSVLVPLQLFAGGVPQLCRQPEAQRAVPQHRDHLQLPQPQRCPRYQARSCLQCHRRYCHSGRKYFNQSLLCVHQRLEQHIIFDNKNRINF